MTCFILPRPVQKLIAALAATLCAAAPALGQNVIRGTAPGWPGNTAYYAPQTVYQTIPAGGAPVVRAQYAPQQAVTAYYAPASAARIAYAVPAAGSYQITYAGANQPGVSTTAYYGGYSAPVQRVAYLPQQVYYAPPTTAAPVTYYRAVVAYQPGAVAVAPQTCGYATTCQTSSCASACGSSGCGWRPFAWLWGNSCCSKPQTCNYGGCGATAAPYYVAPPTAPLIPAVPAPAATYPSRTIIGPATTPVIPPPGTRTGAGGGLIPSVPANERPALNPGTIIPNPGVNPNPGVITPAPGGFGSPSPSFGPPSFAPPPGGGTTVPPEYRPIIEDPYSNRSAPANNPPMLTPPGVPGRESASSGSQIIGSGYSSDRTNLIPVNPAPTTKSNTINEPGNNPGFVSPPSSVQPLRDPHGEDRNQPSLNNRAPQLITPGDRTANNGSRWAVIPAVWPQSTSANLQPVTKSQQSLAPVVAPTQLDDSGWKSAR